jgi:hypothetical protein
LIVGEGRRNKMQSSVATLLLLTSAIVLACFVVNYAVNVAEQTTNPNYISADYGKILSQLTNQTNSLSNQTLSDFQASLDSQNQQTP